MRARLLAAIAVVALAVALVPSSSMAAEPPAICSAPPTTVDVTLPAPSLALQAISGDGLLSDQTTGVELLLPPQLSTMDTGTLTWVLMNHDQQEFASGHIAEGSAAATIALPAPLPPADFYIIEIINDSTGANDFVDLLVLFLWTNGGSTTALVDLTGSPSSFELWSLSTLYQVAAPVTNARACSALRLHAPAGTWTRGPGNVWDAEAPEFDAAVAFYVSKAGAPLTSPTDDVPTVSADGSVLTTTLPRYWYAGRADGDALVVSGYRPSMGPDASDVLVLVNLGSVPDGWAHLTSTIAPQMTGSRAVGGTLALTQGSWTYPPGSWEGEDEFPGELIPYYSWERDGRVLSRTAATYPLTTADAGHTIQGCVVVFRPGHPAERRCFTAAIPLLAAPRATSRPTLAKAPRVGKADRARAGTWTPRPTTFRYQWLLDGKKIKSATRSTVKVKRSWRGHKLSVKVTAGLAGHRPGTAVSAARKVR
jgi:hypothetical protein